ASTNSKLGYEPPGNVTHSFGNSSRLCQERVSLSAVRFATASDCALNFSAQIGASAATTAFSASPFASFRVVPALVQPKPNASTAHHTTAPPTAPQTAGFTSGGIFMGFFLSHLEKKGFP